jgi:hypothetical protein
VPAYRSTPQLSEQQYIILKLQLPSWFQQVGFRLHHKIPCTLGAAQASEPTRQLRTIFCPWGRARTTVLCTCLVLQQSLQNFNDIAGTYLLGLMIDFRSAIPHTKTTTPKLVSPSWFPTTSQNIMHVGGGTGVGAHPTVKDFIVPLGTCPYNNTLQMPRPATETVEFYLIVLMLTYYPQS